MEAREWADKHNLRFVWADDWDVPHIDETHAGVETCEWVALMDDEGNILDSVSCIDDADDDYRRSIEADLNHPEVVAKWAMQDLMAILRQIVDEQS